MRIGEISSSAEFWMSEQFQSLKIFKVKIWFSNLKKNYKFVNFLFWKIVTIRKIPASPTIPTKSNNLNKSKN